MHWLALPVLLLCWAGGVAAQERIEFAARDEAMGRPPGRLIAFVHRPEGAGPFPAVVLHHGCNGAYAPGGQRLSGNQAFWARHLRGRGYLALVVDSFTGRGEVEMCTKGLAQTVPPLMRAEDATAALVWLRARPDVDRQRIAVMGWSHGGGTVMWAASAWHGERRRSLAGGDFVAAIAFYPPCWVSRDTPGYQLALPTTILIGEADDWTPAGPCRELAARTDQMQGRLVLHIYPDAHHGFDSPNVPLMTFGGLPTLPGGKATLGTNEPARQAAIKVVEETLARAFAK